MLLTRRLWGVRAGVIAAAVCLFNPAFIFLSAVWGQNDSLATLILLSAIYLLVTGRTELATIAAVLAMLFKFQYGFAIPIVAIVGLRRHLLGWRRRGRHDLVARPAPGRRCRSWPAS